MPSALISKVFELVDGTGSEMERVAFVVGRGGGHLDDVLPPVDALAAGRQPGADPLPRRRRRRADPAVRGDPPPPSPGARGVDRLHRRRAAPARRAAGPGRPGHRHRGAQHQPAADPADGGVRQRQRREHHADLGRLVRLQARDAPRRRPHVRLPVPAQPLLGRGAAAPQRPRAPVRDYVLDRPETMEFLDKLDDLLTMLISRPTSGRASPT